MPAAAAGAVDIGALAVILALLILLYTIYLANNFAPSFPIIGNVFRDYIGDPLANGIKYLINLVTDAVWNANVAAFTTARATAVYTGGGVWGEFNLIVMYIWGNIATTVATDVQNFINFAYNRDIAATLSFLQTVETNTSTLTGNLQTLLSGLSSRVTILEGTISSLPNPTDIATVASVNAVDAVLIALGGRVNNVQNSLYDVVKNVIPTIQSDITKAESDAASALSKTAVLTQAVGPIITQFPLLADEITTLANDFPNVKKWAAQALAGVDALSPLLVLAALSALAIDTLVNLAEDPCLCLNEGGDFGFIPLYIADQIATGHL